MGDKTAIAWTDELLDLAKTLAPSSEIARALVAATETLPALESQLTARDEVIKALVEVVETARSRWASETHPDYITEVRRHAMILTNKATAALALAKKLEEG